MKKANMGIRGDVYFSYSLFLSILVLFLSSLSVLVFSFCLSGIFQNGLVGVVLFSIPFLMSLLVYLFMLFIPRLKAYHRGFEIDQCFMDTLVFISVLSENGMGLTDIFRVISRHSEFGEIKKETDKIYKDIYLMGNDLITALEKHKERTPSKKFKQFIETTILALKNGKNINLTLEKIQKKYRTQNNKKTKYKLKKIGYISKSYILTLALITLIFFILTGITAIYEKLNFNYLILTIPFIALSIHILYSIIIKTKYKGIPRHEKQQKI